VAVTKRTRFEVLRRDNHQCRYCGATADDAPLTVDHVVPTALGGADDPGNLVAACRDCNAGKTSTSPDASVIEDVSAAQMMWADQLRIALGTAGVEAENAKAYRDDFREHWDRYTNSSGPLPLPRGWISTVDYWMGLRVPISVLENAIDIAMDKDQVRNDARFRYMCGIVWRTLDKAREQAGPVVDDEGDDEEDELSNALAAQYQQGRDTGERVMFKRFAFCDVPHMLLQAVVDGEIRAGGGEFGGLRWISNGS